jgi:hypothetical protein
MVETFTGRFVDTRVPNADTITIEDIAHALSQICRYGGHCQTFYSVAEHAVFVSKRLERRGHGPLRQIGGLHHDDSEAYLGDIPRPLKPLLGAGYARLTERMDKAIIKALDLPFTSYMFHDDEVKAADNWALLVEAKYLLPSKGVNWTAAQEEAWGLPERGRIVTPDYWRGGLLPAEAERLYLARHTELQEVK